jgi:hypothetical protein
MIVVRVHVITWELHQSRPTDFNFGRRLRRYTLSFDNAVIASDGTTHPFGSIACARHASISSTSAALRKDCSVFGVCLQSRDIPVAGYRRSLRLTNDC